MEDLHANKISDMLPSPLFKIHSSEASISNKRLDLYLKGGIFSVTYKILILDLLTKRLSPSIISGLIINNAQKSISKGKTGDTFLAELIRKGNQTAFIHAFTEKPSAVGRLNASGIENMMKSMQVNELLLYPRIKRSVKETLDNESGLTITHAKIQFTKRIEDMHVLLIEIMQACLDEIKC